MNFEEVFKKKLNKTDTLWRYIDLHKLVALGNSMKLYFTRLDSFPDPFEGVTMTDIIRRYDALTSKITNPAIDQSIRDAQDEKNAQVLANYNQEASQKQQCQYANCWLKSARESMAMWDIYSNEESVALKADAQELIVYFKRKCVQIPVISPSVEFICGSIQYLKLNPVDVYDETPLPKYSAFKKDVSFDFEKEFRFLMVTPNAIESTNPPFLEFPIDKEFFDLLQIICHPKMPSWKFDNIAEICKRFDLPTPEQSSIELR